MVYGTKTAWTEYDLDRNSSGTAEVVNPRPATTLLLGRMKRVLNSTFQASHAEYYPAGERCETHCISKLCKNFLTFQLAQVNK
jgi:hypothetical protein